MKRGLQVVFVIAWLPILWLLLSVTLGKVLFMVIGVTWIVQFFVVTVSLLLIFFSFHYLAALSEKIFGDQ